MATEALLEQLSPRGASLELFTPIARPRVDFGGVFVDSVDLSQAVERIAGFLRTGVAHQVVTVNLDFLSIAGRDESFRSAINRADLAVPDGMPLVWISRVKGQPLAERVAGVELVDACCALAAEAGRGVYLLGAAPGVAEAAARNLVARHPGLQVVGTFSPPVGLMSRKQNERIVRDINAARPAFLFVALGAPRQDLWIRTNLSRLNVSVAMGVGCTLDVLAGVVSRAPLWMQRSGLEWAYRLVSEPRRLWRRYILDDLPLLARLIISSAARQSAGLTGTRSADAAEIPVLP